MLSDGVLFHQVAHQVNVSVQTVCLWKRKLQSLTKSQENTQCHLLKTAWHAAMQIRTGFWEAGMPPFWFACNFHLCRVNKYLFLLIIKK
jgi:hypothetical protein